MNVSTSLYGYYIATVLPLVIKQICCSVPLRSILGPLLLIVYVKLFLRLEVSDAPSSYFCSQRNNTEKTKSTYDLNLTFKEINFYRLATLHEVTITIIKLLK